jgi:ABC-2 type transport system ATP-binding protein
MLQAEALCDRVVMIHQGRKVLDDAPSAIRARFNPHTVAVEPRSEQAAERDFASIPGVGSVTRRGHLFELHATPDADLAAIMSRACAASPLNRVEVVRPSLEDVFIDIVQQSLPPEERAALVASLRSPISTLASSLSSGEGGGD